MIRGQGPGIRDQGSGTKGRGALHRHGITGMSERQPMIRGQGSGIRDQGSGIRDEGSGRTAPPWNYRHVGAPTYDQGSGIRDQGSGTKGRGALHRHGITGMSERQPMIRDQGSGIRDQGPGIRDEGLGRTAPPWNYRHVGAPTYTRMRCNERGRRNARVREGCTVSPLPVGMRRFGVQGCNALAVGVSGAAARP
jgi:hypothetical protein